MTDQITYLDAAAATDAGTAYKRRLLELLCITPDQTVVDIGCGPGTDLRSLAKAVHNHGRVIGVDRDPRMVEEAKRRHPQADIRQADLLALPLPDDSVDRARVDRVLQHVAEPPAAVAEVRRVLRPGGLVGLAEPDWDTLTVADPDEDTSQAFARFNAGQVRNPTLGRDLAGLCTRAGFHIRTVEPTPIVFHDFPTADRILGLTRNSSRAVANGDIPQPRAEAWLHRLKAGPVTASFTFYLAVAEA
ncbi:methyltransferase domain-containing protein [Paractinoplanes maris]|uniref:methyltransferase domain-containing protein n=1 Tax=Paractinoplanes maris TaxID=1734446 RepID=UPI0020212F08|nr:methyltransferase domain-containing protein [Actinoplanes maris]